MVREIFRNKQKVVFYYFVWLRRKVKLNIIMTKKWDLVTINNAKKLMSEGISSRETSKILNIPKTTLLRLLKTDPNEIPKKPGPSPLLNLEEEDDIVNWLLRMEEFGCPRTRHDVITQVSILFILLKCSYQGYQSEV